MVKNAWRTPPAGFNGFIPLEGHMAESDLSRTPSTQHAPLFAEEMMHYFEELYSYCRSHGTFLFLVHGPRAVSGNGGDLEWVPGVEKLAAEHPGVKFINISEQTYPEPFATDHRLYADKDHLNSEGAKLYSTMVANEIHQYVIQAPPLRP